MGKRLFDNKIVGGIELSRWYPELATPPYGAQPKMVTRQNIDTGSAGVAAGLVEA